MKLAWDWISDMGLVSWVKPYTPDEHLAMRRTVNHTWDRVMNELGVPLYERNWPPPITLR